MRRFLWPVILLPLAGCGGGGKPVLTLSVACGGTTQLYGATSIDVLGEVQNGHPTLAFPDPVNPGKTGTIEVRPGDRCTITPLATSAK
jgi:hypothetical protein